MNTVTPLRPIDTAEEPGYRQPPHNLEAEQALLGAIMVNNEACDRVTTFLTAEHFFEPLPHPHGQTGQPCNAKGVF
jgi:replicative DNA helicase